MIFTTPAPDDRELAVITEIDGLRKRLEKQTGGIHVPRRWSGAIRRVAMARAIQGSNSIEGINAQPDDVVAVDLGEKPLSADEDTRLAIKGYRDAMTYVLQVADDPDFTYSQSFFKSLHFMMTNHDLKNRPGQWRQGPIYVQKDETGDRVYEGPDVVEVPGLVKELVEQLNADENIPVLIRAGMAHLNLVMIHPFRDGNGRMSRCLQTMVIARDGSAHPLFSSIEEYLGRNTPAYYDVLLEVGGGKWQPQRDARPWVRFTLKAHLFQLRRLTRRIARDQQLWSEIEDIVKKRALPERTVLALFDAGIGFRVRNSTYRAADPDEISDMTASRDLRQLVEAGLLEPHGENRGRYYEAGAQIVEIRHRLRSAEADLDKADPFEVAPAEQRELLPAG